MPARTASVGVIRDPFALLVDAGDFRPVADGETLASMAPQEPGAWLCLVDNQAIPRSQWHCAPRPGSVVCFRALAGGGKGSNPLRTILQIAALALLTTGIPFLGLPGLGLSGGRLLLATLGANALINNLVPIDGTNVPSGGAQQFSVGAQQNQARVGQPVPELFGFDHGWPDLAAQPYSLYADNEQYLYLLLVVGVGEYELQRVDVGDTQITSFADATVVRIGTGQATRSGPGTGVESLGDLTLVDAAWVTSQDVSQVEMTTLDYVGPFSACSPERTVDRIGIDIVLPRGLDSGRSVTWRVEKREVDDFDAALGAWATVATVTYSTASVVPVRLSYEYATAAGRWQVRLVRTDTRSSSDGSAHDVSWLALRGHLVDGTPDVGGVTYVAVRVRASGQLSGALRFRVQSRRLLPTWDGVDWTDPTDTRNPAWAFARVLKARDIPDAQIDLDQLQALAAVWDARQDRFDYRFDTQLSTWDALTMIARVGRAVPLIRNGRYTMVRDAQETAPVALYGMRNIRRGSMRLGVKLPESDGMRALDLEYWDHRRWNWVTVTAQQHAGAIYGYRGDANRPVSVPAPDPLRRGRIKMPGIIGQNQAIRTAVYTLADALYRRMPVDIDTELDGLLPAPLSLVVFQHDVGNFGQGGDAVTWDAGTRTLTTTEPLMWTLGERHYVRLMNPRGQLSGAIEVMPGSDDHSMVLDAAQLATESAADGWEIVTDDADRERTRYVFGAANAVGALAKVRAIVPRSERTVALRLLLEDDRVHTADNAWLPGGAEQDPVGDGSSVGGGSGDRIVVLEPQSWSSSYPAAAPPDMDGRVTVRNDGRLSLGFRTSPNEVTFPATHWLNPQTVTADVAALYEVRFEADNQWDEASDLTYGGSALDTWLSLGTTRAVTVSCTGTADPLLAGYAGVIVSIREAASGIVQATALMSFRSVQSPDP
jgi:hypothetical protein